MGECATSAYRIQYTHEFTPILRKVALKSMLNSGLETAMSPISIRCGQLGQKNAKLIKAIKHNDAIKVASISLLKD